MSLRLLLVEDDAATREFVPVALSGLFDVDAVRSLAEACDRCAAGGYDLLLVDVGLPDGDGDAWLARQRALGNRTPAVALTADLAEDRRQRLLACGFAEALGKPITAPALCRALLPWSAAASAAGEPGWDDRRAMAAVGGVAATVDRMRALFLAELPQQRERVAEAGACGDTAAMRAVLHQMRAGCGFVGAVQLGEAVAALHREPDSAALLAALLARIDATLATPA